MSPRTFPVLLCLATLATAAPAYASVRHTERSDRVVEAKGIRTVEVDNARGDVEVAPSPDGRIRVTALKICRGRDLAEAKRFAAAIGVTAGTQGDRYVVKVTYPKRVDIRVNFWEVVSGRADRDDFGRSHELRLLMQVPPATSVRLASESGDLAARGLTGRQWLHTASGDCLVEAAGGTVEVATASGDARVRGPGRAIVRTTSGDIRAASEGPLEARTSSGDVDVESAADSLVISTSSGDITVDDARNGLSAATSSGSIDVASAAGAVDLRSTSGEVSVVLRAPLARASASSTSGSVELGLPPGLDATLELSTTSGDIECDVPVILLGHGRQHLNAKYGRGGAVVKARTVSGDIHVTSGGERK